MQSVSIARAGQWADDVIMGSQTEEFRWDAINAILRHTDKQGCTDSNHNQYKSQKYLIVVSLICLLYLLCYIYAFIDFHYTDFYLT